MSERYLLDPLSFTLLIILVSSGCASSEGVSEEEYEDWDPRSENVTNLQPVTSSSSVDDYPRYAGDGKIIFSSDRDGVQDIWIKSISGGGGTKQLTDYSEADIRPDAHPNGKNFTFISERGERPSIFMGHFERRTARALAEISEPSFGEFSPAVVSPDGSRIAYASGSHIWIYSIDEGTQTQMVTGQQPSWHPNGEEIVFVRKAGEVGEGITTSIWMMDSNGTNLRQLKSSGKKAVYLHPSISPNGEKICYTRAPIEDKRTGDIGNEDIWMMNVDGTGQVRLTTNPFDDREPAWTSNKDIVFTSLRPKSGYVKDVNWDIWTLSL